MNEFFYHFDFKALSKENIFLILAIVKNKDAIIDSCNRQMQKLVTGSMALSIDKAYSKATNLIIKRALTDFLYTLSHKYIDNLINRDMLFSKITRTTDGHSYDRHYYDKRNREVQQFGYFLAKNGITNKTVDEIKLKSMFYEFLQISREAQESETRNKRSKENEKTK